MKTIEELKSAIQALRSVEAYDIAQEFEEKFSEEYEAAEEGCDLAVIAKSIGLYKFSVSTIPVDPDYSDLEKTIQEQIEERIELIESEIESITEEST